MVGEVLNNSPAAERGEQIQIPSPPALRGEMPKAEGGSVLTAGERQPPSVTP